MSPRDTELIAYIVVLREALQGLVDAIRRREDAPPMLKDAGLFSLTPETQRAEQVLRMETGRHAQQDLAINARLIEQGYVLADWAHYHVYGTPRSPRGGIPTSNEVGEALAAIKQLTQASWALDALLL